MLAQCAISVLYLCTHTVVVSNRELWVMWVLSTYLLNVIIQGDDSQGGREVGTD